MTKKKTGTTLRKGAASKKAATRKPARKSKPTKPRRPAALDVACPSCGASINQPCLSFNGSMGHRRAMEEALKFNAYAAHTPEPHASRIAAYEAQQPKRSAGRSRSRPPALD
jgi:hypothetical protein